MVRAQNGNSVNLLYIVGTGRSGSTILDIVLGNHPDIESTGELGILSRTGWVGQESAHEIEDERRRLPVCTCGKRFDAPTNFAEACPFWSSVRREWRKRAGQDDIEGYPALVEAFDRYRYWPRLLREGRKPSSRFRAYARLTRTMFESVHAVSGKPLIVDSSKHAPRALALTMMPGIDLHLVHLVRDPRAVAASRKKFLRKDIEAGIWWDHKSEPVWKSSMRWVQQNLMSEWACAQLDAERVLRIRHEDFLEDPRGMLDRIGALIGFDLSGLAEATLSGETMQVGHLVGGNRVRRAKKVVLQPDKQEWREKLSAGERRTSETTTAWLMRRYGYKRESTAL
jgi:hypothetical protein